MSGPDKHNGRTDRFFMDADTKQYLDDFRKDIKQSLENLEKHIKELIESTVRPIEKQQDRHTEDIDKLFNLDREMKDRVGCVEGRVKVLEDDKGDGKFQKEIKTAVMMAVAAMFVSVVLWVLSIFIK